MAANFLEIFAVGYNGEKTLDFHYVIIKKTAFGVRVCLIIW